MIPWEIRELRENPYLNLAISSYNALDEFRCIRMVEPSMRPTAVCIEEGPRYMGIILLLILHAKTLLQLGGRLLRGYVSYYL